MVECENLFFLIDFDLEEIAMYGQMRGEIVRFFSVENFFRKKTRFFFYVEKMLSKRKYSIQ